MTTLSRTSSRGTSPARSADRVTRGKGCGPPRHRRRRNARLVSVGELVGDDDVFVRLQYRVERLRSGWARRVAIDVDADDARAHRLEHLERFGELRVRQGPAQPVEVVLVS